jgi:hypothetical protein
MYSVPKGHLISQFPMPVAKEARRIIPQLQLQNRVFPHAPFCKKKTCALASTSRLAVAFLLYLTFIVVAYICTKYRVAFL